MLTRAVVAGLGVAALFAVGPAFAQSQGAGAGSPPAPSGGIPVGPLTVYPAIDLAQGYDDNLFLRPNNQTSSSYTVLSPSVRAEGKTGPHRFDLGLRIDDGRFHSSPSDSYVDYSLLGNADLVFSARQGLKLRAEHKHGHDGRGVTDRAVSGAPDEYDNTGIDGIFRYGAQGAQGRIEVDAGAFARRYTNNRATTQVSDRDTTQLGGTFYWRVMPKTELLVQGGVRNVDYKLASSTQDSMETRLLFGAKWDATAATSGRVGFGVQSKTFDAAGRQDVSNESSWDAAVRWSPLSYSTFDFSSSKQAGEATGVGDAIIAKSYGVTWNHAWSSRLRTQALASFRNDTFAGATGGGRKDDTTTFGLKVGYEFRRWLKFGVEYTHAERDSNGVNLNYKRNLLLFTVGATL